jgi:hypothetical protein
MTDRRVFLVGFGIPDVKTISTLLQTTLRADFALPFPEIRYIKLIALVAPKVPSNPGRVLTGSNIRSRYAQGRTTAVLPGRSKPCSRRINTQDELANV